MRGREHELQLAGDCLRAAAQGPGQVLLIEGEPGIGKSALLAEVTALAARRGFALAPATSAGTSWTPGIPPSSGLAAREFPAAAFNAIQALVERRTAVRPVLISL